MRTVRPRSVVHPDLADRPMWAARQRTHSANRLIPSLLEADVRAWPCEDGGLEQPIHVLFGAMDQLPMGDVVHQLPGLGCGADGAEDDPATRPHMPCTKVIRRTTTSSLR